MYELLLRLSNIYVVGEELNSLAYNKNHPNKNLMAFS